MKNIKKIKNIKNVTILKTLVGSQAHSLADKDSDYDYRGVYILPTSKILSLNYKYKGNDWIEGKEDNTSYEIGHFLKLATKCNPTIMEVFKAPIVESTKEGRELRKLLPYVWNLDGVFNAWTGYGFNQRKKFLEDREKRANKYAVAWIRTLINLVEFLMTGDWTVKIGLSASYSEMLKRYKSGDYTKGEVLDEAEYLYNTAKIAYEKHTPKETDYEKVNNFLLTIRKKFWN